MPEVNKLQSFSSQCFRSEPAIDPSTPWPFWLASLAVGGLAIGLFFFHLGSYGLWEPDEGRYAEIAREMVASGNYIVPHMNYVPYVEKPPLLYWLSVLSMRLFGVNEFGARFVNATAALVAVGAVYYFALRTFDRRRAILSALILTSCALYAVMAQVLTTDMLLTATMTIAMLALYLHWREGGAWCWLMYIAAGIAVLTKGPVGAAIPAVVGFVFLIVQRDLRGFVRRFHLVAGSLLTLLIAAPWFIAIARREPDFVDFYFIGEHLKRFFEPTYSHGEPFYYYIPVVAAGSLPWSLLIPFVRWRRVDSNHARRFCLVAAAVIFLLFSAASAKLIPYILPAFPFFAVLMADVIATTVDAGSARLAYGAALLIPLGLVATVVAVLANRFASPNPMFVRTELYAAGIALIAGGSAAFGYLRKRRFTIGLGAIVATAAVGLIIASYGRIADESSRSYATLARTIALRAPHARLICYPRYIDSLPFYTHRRVILVGAKTELAYGAEHSPDGAQYFFTRQADVIRLWNEPQPSVLIVDRGAFRGLEPKLGPYAIVASDAKKIAVTQASVR